MENENLKKIRLENERRLAKSKTKFGVSDFD